MYIGDTIILAGLVLLTIIVLGLIILLIYDITHPSIKEGYVIRKYDTKTYTSTVMVGKVFVPIIHPHCWYVEISEFAPSSQQKGKCATFSVTESYYNSLQNGDYVSFS